MLKAPCPNCGEKLTIREEDVGKPIHCKKCKVLLQLDSEAPKGFSLRGLLASWRRRKAKAALMGAG